MDLEKLLPLLLSSAVISTIITYLSNKKDREMSGISSERLSWGNKVREISEKIRETDDDNELLKLIDMLIVRINPSGKIEKDNNFTKMSEKISYLKKDGLLWESIDIIKDKIDTDKEDKITNEDKDMLIFGISIALKNNWEQSKLEIQGSILKYISILCIPIIAGSIVFISITNKLNPLGDFTPWAGLVSIFILILNYGFDWENIKDYIVALITLLNIAGLIALICFLMSTKSNFMVGVVFSAVYFCSFFTCVSYQGDINKSNKALIESIELYKKKESTEQEQNSVS